MLRSTTWFDIYRNRNAWALRAYADFLSGIAPELFDTLPQSEQITVAVYGATQVGKTTLILELMGLSSLTDDEAGSVLRGGQELGKSATSMPIRYGRSKDGDWYIGGSGPLSADRARNFMRDFRQQVESGQRMDAEVLEVCIPGRLFPDGSDYFSGRNLNIIDIPGINSHNISEQGLVARLAERYVAAADIVLLVGRADSMGFLNKDDLILPALAGWSLQPSRFRIVLTYGFSPNSLLEYFKDRDLTVDTVRQAIIDQMKTHDYGFPEGFRNNLFVMEMGNSVSDLKKSNPDYHGRITSVSGDFLCELRKNIGKSTSPYSRLYGAFQLDRVINARNEALSQEFKRIVADLDEEIRQRLAELSSLEPELNDAKIESLHLILKKRRDDLVVATKELSAISGGTARIKAVRLVDRLAVSVPVTHEEKVEWLKEQLKELEKKQEALFGEAVNLVSGLNLYSSWDDDFSVSSCYRRDCLIDIENKLYGYKVDWYLRSSSFLRDKRSLEMAFDRNAESNAEALESEAERVLMKGRSVLQGKLERLRKSLFILESAGGPIDRLEEKKINEKRKFDNERERMKYSSEWVSGFEGKINFSFSVELKRVRGDIFRNPVPAKRFFSILNAKLLLSEVRRFYEGKSH